MRASGETRMSGELTVRKGNKFKGDDYKKAQRETRKEIRGGFKNDVKPSAERKSKTRARVQTKEKRIREEHQVLNEVGVQRRVGGSRLGLRKRRELVEAQG